MVSGDVQEGGGRRGWLLDRFDGRYGGRGDGLLMSGAAGGGGVMGRSGFGAMIADGVPVRRRDEARGRADEEGEEAEDRGDTGESLSHDPGGLDVR